MKTVEQRRTIPLTDEYQVVICGGGPAGVSAAIAAGRLGARTLLLESGGALGGIWTSGQLCLVLDYGNKTGILEEIRDRLAAGGAHRPRYNGPRGDFTYDVETMKLLLEQMCSEAGVDLLLHSRVTDALVRDRRISEVVVDGHGGPLAFRADTFVDTTGNGDVGAFAGVPFESGHPKTGKIQPATMFAIVSGAPPGQETTGREDKQRFRALLNSVGVEPTYRSPSLFALPHPGLFCLMTNHEYGVRCDSLRLITDATVRARAELHKTVERLRTAPGWEDIRVVITADHIGLREGRRLAGRYTVTVEDVLAGSRFKDGICRVRFPVDIHALEPDFPTGTTNEGYKTTPYDIPFRSLVARGLSNLALAGRCVSGDFYAHASYRVTGNAVPMGEAAGIGGGLASERGIELAEVDGREVRSRLIRSGHVLDEESSAVSAPPPGGS